MLRKKNITVNGKKADGAAILSKGDQVRFYLSDEVLSSISKDDSSSKDERGTGSEAKNKRQSGTGTDNKNTKEEKKYDIAEHILYEDDHLILFDKPAGMLSQKAKPDDISANEYLLSYLESKQEMPVGFVPSVCNRLDRNTSGILLFAKSHGAAKQLAELLRDRTFGKYYLAVIAGKVEKPFRLTGMLAKDRKTNQVSVKEVYKQELTNEISRFETDADETGEKYEKSDKADTKQEKTNKAGKDERKPDKMICTEVWPVQSNGYVSLVRVHLLTGKTHQIRAHLASVGHPLIGDPKYGNPQKEKAVYAEFSVNGKDIPKRQLLHSQRVTFPKMPNTEGAKGALAPLSDKTFYTQLPEDMDNFLQAVGITDRSFLAAIDE
ncbi:MAG: RluA family pseudouridine synthase [Lachnospiraceae bacterium]|nr:RluA family pseudouridine synthase [Lachnospiraceae bacterium]